MKTTNPNWNMKKLQRMEKSGELRFDYPIQRASGQWDELQQSLLIHSIIGGFPIPPIAIAKADVDGEEAEYVIDGKQRTTTVLGFISGVADEEGNYPEGAWHLHEDTPSVMIGKEEIELSGKFFDQLNEEAQTDILSSNFLIQRMEDATDEEIEELFSRWNNGTPLTKQQKARAKMGTANAKIIDSLLKHSFIKLDGKVHFTKLQRKRGDDEAVIIQTMMLMSDYDIPSNGFVADNILKFASEMREMDITPVTNVVKEAFDYANQAIEAKHPLLKKLHLPTFLLIAKKAKDENIEPEVFMAWVDDFNNAINGRTRDKALVKTNYKNYTNAGSVKKEKTLGRKQAMTTHFNEFIDRYEPTIEEPQDLSKGEVAEVVEESKEVKEVKGKKAKKEVVELEQKPDAEEVFAGLELVN